MRRENRTRRHFTTWAGALALTGGATLVGGTAAHASPANDGGVQVSIVGGHPATEHYSAMLSLQVKDGKEYVHSCGATLIDPQWAVTAAHCVDPESKTDRVRIGSATWKAGGHVVTVTKQIAFQGKYKQDLGLIKLAQAVPGAPMKIGQVPAIGSSVRLIGWGLTSPEGTESPTVLQEVDSRLLRISAYKDAAKGDLCIDDPKYRRPAHAALRQTPALKPAPAPAIYRRGLGTGRSTPGRPVASAVPRKKPTPAGAPASAGASVRSGNPVAAR